MRKRQVAGSGISPEARGPLESIAKAGRFVIDWSGDVNEHRLWADKQKRAAVERQFEVIAEALRRLREVDPITFHGIEDAETAIRLGEVIRRDYDKINYGILWRTTRFGLPEMLRQVEDLLAKPAL